MITWFKHNKYLAILLLLAIIFLFIYSSFYVKTGPRFTSPDETANYYFIKQFADKSTFTFSEPLNNYLNGLVHPRSMGTRDGHVLPGSFLGMIIIFGSIAKLFGSWIILYLTPLFAVISVIFFYLLLKKFFRNWVAFVSAILLFISPPFWYYSARGMFHNVLFCSLLIIGIYFLISLLTSEKNKNKILLSASSGLFIGLALLVRTSEITWVAALALALLIIGRKKINWQCLAAMILPVFIFLLILLSLNHQIYGSALSFAYDNSAAGAGDSSSVVLNTVSIFQKINKLIFPFDFNITRMMDMAKQYLIVALPLFSILLLAGLAGSIGQFVKIGVKKIVPELNIRIERISAWQTIYVVCYLAILAWLIIYYGSYKFAEFHDGDLPVMGSSYFRYWLPIYIFGLPLIVLVLEKIIRFFKKRPWQVALTLLFAVGFAYQSITWVINEQYYGLTQINKYVQSDKSRSHEVENIVSVKSIIISGFADKVFFPGRKVIVSLNNKSQNRDVLANISSATPIYYYYQPSDTANAWMKDFLNQKPFALKQMREYSNPEAVLYQLIRL